MVNVVFAEEPYVNCVAEIERLHEAHFLEVACDQKEVPLAKDTHTYWQLSAAGSLVVITARANGILVGYVIGITRMGLHNVTTLMGATDLFYLMPEYRKGWNGIKMFKVYEEAMKRRGVVKLYIQTKLHSGLDMSKIFEYLDFVPHERLFSKLL
jgi:hypothetical protein